MPGAATTAVVGSRRGTQHAEGPATIIAIGTANPANIVPQDEFADYYFGLTKSEHLTELKDKMKRICQKSGIEKRYNHPYEEIITAHPEIIDKHMPSLEARVDIVASELASLLGLRPTVSRAILSLHGCSGGARALQLAKELVENNRGARILVALSELTLICFSAPDESKIVGHGLFGDGAGAIIIGAGPLADGERPLFEMATSSGIDFHISIQLPTLIRDNIQQSLLHSFCSVGNTNTKWNDLFCAVHPGGRMILDNIEGELQLQPWKLAASRQVLREYGNMSGATIAFVLDELRQCREKEKQEPEQPEWGVMLAFGPGITIETMILRNPLPHGLMEN
uniref:Chalcone synthase n=1 Tax=Oryza glumipatula TaxID=40148 RepID=A0A0E0B8B4_9ORYZ